MKTRYLCLFILIAMLPPTDLSMAAESLKDRLLEDKGARWDITAERISYLEKEGVYIAEGDVVITRDGQVLRCQRAVYNEKQGTVNVSGSFQLDVDEDTVTGVSGLFDLNRHQGNITGGKLFIKKNHFYISGDTMEKTGPETYRVTQCRVTTCDGPKPDWSITGSEVEVTVEGYGTVKHATFRIRDIPVFYIPYALFPAKTKRQTGLLPPRFGYSDRNGMDVELPLFWAISDQTDATFYGRYMHKRGYMQGLEFRYLTKDTSKGAFLFDILQDKIENKDMSDPDNLELSPFSRTNTTRYWMRGKADQNLPLGIALRMDADYVSDQDYLKEFRGNLYGIEARPNLVKSHHRPIDDIFSPTRRSALRLSRDGEDYGLQATSSYYQRPENPPNDRTPQPLAGFNFSLLPKQFFHFPLSLTFQSDYDYIWREFGAKGHRLSLLPELSYPIWFGRYLTFEPSVSYSRTTQWVGDNPDNIGNQSENAYQFQARFSSLLERTFDFVWRDTKKLKHKIIPSLTYRFRSLSDEEPFEPWFESVDLEGNANLIVFTLENFLDAKNVDSNGKVSYTQWAKFSLSQGYDIGEERRDDEPGVEKEPFEPLIGVFRLTPYRGLNFQAEAHWDHSINSISFTDLSLELTLDRAGGKKDRFMIDYQYEEGISENLNYRIHINLAHGFSAGTSLKKELLADHRLESSYWLDYESQCWGLRLAAEDLEGISSVMVSFRLIGLGGL